MSIESKKLVIVNKDSITKRLALVAGVSLAGFFLMYSLPKIVTTMREERQYNQKIQTVKEEISTGKFDLAEKLIQSYGAGKILSEGDVLLLSSLLNEEKETAGNKEKTFLEAALLKKAEQEKEFSEENLLQKIRALVGEEKINLIEKFSELYPNNRSVSTLKQEELDAYLLVCESYFTTNSRGSALEESLNKFYSFLANNKKLLQEDFSEFIINGEEYISVMKDQKPTINQNLKIGDKVTLVKTLGSLNGRGENQYYYPGENPEQHPFGSIGTIVGLDRKDGGYKVCLENSDVWKFEEGELELAESLSQIKNTNSLAKIQQYLTSIKQLVEEQR